MTLFRIIVLLTSVSLLGCDRAPYVKPPAKPIAGVAEDKEVDPVIKSSPDENKNQRLLTDAHKKQFVDSILATANSGNVDLDILDNQAIATKAADIQEVQEPLRAIFIDATTEGCSENSLGRLIVSQVRDGGKFTFFRYSTRDGVDTAIFRSLTVDLILDYIELEIPPASSANPTLALDIYTYSTAEWLTKAIADIALQRSIAKDQTVLGKLARGVAPGENDAQILSNMIEQLNHQNFAGAFAAYHSLSPAIQQSKICLILRHKAAQAAQDDAERLATIEDMCRYFPDDSSVALLAIDLYSAKKEYGKAMKSIDNLERAVGRDPYLDVLRSSILFEANDLDEAIAMAKKALAVDSSFELAHWTIVSASMAKSDFTATTIAMRSLQSLGKVTPDEVTASPDFGPYAASPEFKAWKAESEAKK